MQTLVNRRSTLSSARRNTGNGFEVLGAAVTSPECFFLLAETCSKSSVALGKFELFGYPQCALGVLLYCLETPKLVYSLRTNTPTRYLIDFLKVFNSSQRDTLDQIIGTITCDNTWKQSTLPKNISGLGVRQSQEQYRAAYVGSVLASDDLVQKITNQHASDRVLKELYKP